MNKRDRENAKNVWITRQLEKNKVWQYLRRMNKINNLIKRGQANG